MFAERAERRYLPLDHWRGVACLLVLLNHTVWFRKGSWLEEQAFDVASRLWIGVPVFFVISGYCIAAAVDAQRSRSDRPLLHYFTRRLRRIFPPYWAVLFGTVLAVAVIDVVIPGRLLSGSGVFLRPWWYSPESWLGNVTLTETWRYHLIPSQKALFLGHAWTLCYEEQFYIVCGLLLWLMPRRFFLGASLVSLGVGALVLLKVGGASIEGFFFDGSWFQFWYGVVLYHALVWGSQAERRVVLLGFVALAGASAWDPSRLLDATKNGWQATFVASGFAAVALMLRPFDAKIAAWRALSAIRICGAMCYSLYLVHLPVANLIKAGFLSAGLEPRPLVSVATTAPICLAVAWWFHVKVERRFMNPSIDAPAKPAKVMVSAGPAGATSAGS